MANFGNNITSSSSFLPATIDAKVVLVKTIWNQSINNALEAGAVKILDDYKAKHTTIEVPGAIELPFAIKNIAAKLPDVHAIIAFGCVIKGDTPHFDYVCQSVTQGITALNLTLPIPIIFGVLTVLNENQAIERIGGVHGHKGEEAAITALQMIVLQQATFTF